MGILRKVFKSMFERDKWRILRGDKVMIMAGKDRGQIGTVLKVIRDDKYPRVVVEGLNLVSLKQCNLAYNQAKFNFAAATALTLEFTPHFSFKFSSSAEQA